MSNSEKIKEQSEMISKMRDKHDVVYFDLLGQCIMQGMDVETAIYYCWNKLMTR